MSASPAKGEWTSKHYRTKASTQYTKGMMVANDGTDIVPATAASNSILGIVDQQKDSSDATNDRIKVLVPVGESATAEIDVSTGSATAALEGRTFDLTDANGVNVTASVQSPVRLEKFLSATKAEFRFA